MNVEQGDGSTPRRPMVFIELNEVPYRVLDEYCRRFPGSALASVMTASGQFVTQCEDEIELDPWISWPTLHRGVIDREHRILRLGQSLAAVDARWPPIWRRLADAGVSVGVFGSLHSSHIPANVEDYAFYVPDFFDDAVFARPTYLEPFQAFNLGMTRRSARNVDTGIPLGLVASFVRSFGKLGVTAGTLAAIAHQLFIERREPRRRLRRRSLQARLMGDVFVRQLQIAEPDFACFYTNHVAASMHRYWAGLFPGDYENLAVDAAWVDFYRDEIMEALHVFDAMLRPIVAHCRKLDCRLVVASSMGQAAEELDAADDFATITDIGAFMEMLGFPAEQFELRSAMVPSVGVKIDPARVAELTAKLDQITLDGFTFESGDEEKLPLSYFAGDDGFVSILTCENGYRGPREIVFAGQTVPFEACGFDMMPHEDGVSVTAHHVPQGVLVVFDPLAPTPASERPTISTCDIAPAILDAFGLAPPSAMRPVTGAIFSERRAV